MKIRILMLFSISVLVFNAGCARTVTSIITYGTQAEVEITLRGTMEATDARSFLVLSSSRTYSIPLPYPLNPNNFEFIEPGMVPQLGSITDYYTNFYSGWAGYVMTAPEGYILVPGPFVQGTTASREVLGSLGEINNKIKFLFTLDRLFGATIPATIYFDIVSVSWPTGAAKFSIDHINSTDAYISKISGSKISVTDEEDLTLDPGLDILNCTVTIQ